MFTAVFDAGYGNPMNVDSIRAGSLVTVSDPIPLDTFTTTGLSERSSSGRNARVMRTMPKTFVSKTRSRSDAVTSATGLWSPLMPALLMRTSSAPLSAATRSAASPTLRSSVTSSSTKRAPSS
jgi:hypothetical protein